MKYVLLAIVSFSLWAQEYSLDTLIAHGNWQALLSNKTTFEALSQDQKIAYLKEAQAVVLVAYGDFERKEPAYTGVLDIIGNAVITGSLIGLVVNLLLLAVTEPSFLKTGGITTGVTLFTGGILTGLYLRLNPSQAVKNLDNALIVREIITNWSRVPKQP